MAYIAFARMGIHAKGNYNPRRFAPSVWDDSEWGSGGFQSGVSFGRRRYEDRGRTPPTPAGAVGGFILIVVIALVLAAAGAPGLFVGMLFLFALIALVGGLAASKNEAERKYMEELAEDEARERFVDDVATSVKERMTGMIKVRCRYCGALNGEHDEKCESCGAPL